MLVYKDTPYLSQFQAVRDEVKKFRACWIVNFAMAAGLLDPGNPLDPNDLIEEYEMIQSDMVKRGLLTELVTSHGRTVHQVLIYLIHNHGFAAHAEEFKAVTADTKMRTFSPSSYLDGFTKFGLKKLCDQFAHGVLPIVSVDKGFGRTKDSHAILIVGAQTDEKDFPTEFVYHNSDDRRGEGAFETTSLERFLKHWRRLAIFIGPKVKK